MDNINDFGRSSFVNWTPGLIGRVKKMEKDFICLSNDETFSEDDLHQCPKCGEFSCPTCGAEVSTISEYNKALRDNAEEE